MKRLQRLVEAASDQLGRVDPEPFLDEAARLDHAAYEHAREPIAKLLGWRVSSLDEDRKVRRMHWAASEAANDPDIEPVPEEHQPWPEPVPDIRPVLDAALAELGRYIVADELVLAAAVLWSALAHLLSRDNLGLDVAPRLAVQGVVRGVGKTTMLEAISNLVPDPIFAGSITSSSLFRIIDARRPTLLIDEADRLFNGHNEELLAICNSGHRRASAYVLRSVPQPDGTYVAVQFSTFAPIAFAGIDALPETQQDRSIVLRLKRALAGELKHHLRDGKSAVLLEFRRKLARWAADLEELPDPAMPKALFNRPGDNWRPLLAIAQIAGGEWPRLARRAALASLKDEDPNELIRLLASIRTVFVDKGVERITTGDLLKALLDEEEGPWGEANRGKPITASWLRERLKDILPKTEEAKRARKWKEGGRSQRGYARRHFEDLWHRYLLPDGGTSSSDPSATSASSENNGDKADTYPEADRTDQPATEAADTRHSAHNDDQRAGVTAAVAHTNSSSASEISEDDQELTAKEADEAGKSRERPPVGDNDIPSPTLTSLAESSFDDALGASSGCRAGGPLVRGALSRRRPGAAAAGKG